jgi:hypothetical protein
VGLTFALARVLVLVAGFACHASGAADMADPRQREAVFVVVSWAAAVACVGGAELAVRRLRAPPPRPGCGAERGEPW